MKKIIFATAMALTASLTAAPLPIIPKPAKTEVMDGQFTHIKEAAKIAQAVLAKETHND